MAAEKLIHLGVMNWGRGACGADGPPPPLHLTAILDRVNCPDCQATEEFKTRSERAATAQKVKGERYARRP